MLSPSINSFFDFFFQFETIVFSFFFFGKFPSPSQLSEGFVLCMGWGRDVFFWFKGRSAHGSTAGLVPGTGTALQALALMARCSHFLLTTGSFGWWGAYLSAKPNSTTIVCGEYTCAPVPSSWPRSCAMYHIQLMTALAPMSSPSHNTLPLEKGGDSDAFGGVQDGCEAQRHSDPEDDPQALEGPPPVCPLAQWRGGLPTHMWAPQMRCEGARQ